MKILISNQYLFRRYFLVIFSLLWLSCSDDDNTVDYNQNAAINQSVLDPYLQVTTGFVPFKPGTAEYTIGFNVINGVKALDKVNIYATFKDAGTGKSSNEVLVETYDIDSPYRTVVTDQLTYNELKEGFTINDGSLPASDEDIVPGSGWTFRFEGVEASGNAVDLPGAINMVLSKYAGLYVVSESTYVRGPGEFLGDWNGTEVFIGHVDEVTLSYNDRWGVFDWSGCSFNFSIDPTSKAITVPILTDCGVFSGTGAINCKDNAGSFKNLSDYLGHAVCPVSNILIDDEVNGKHVIKLTYGYMGANGIPRAFTETLTKIVD
jgi:hypothetical protein